MAVGLAALQILLDKGQEADWFASAAMRGLAVAAVVGAAEVAAENAAVAARRAEQLFARQLIARQALDAAQAAARKRTAEAALKLSYTHITAPGRAGSPAAASRKEPTCRSARC